MPDIPKGLVPARYIGGTGFELAPDRKYYNIDGSIRMSRDLSFGDELLMPEREVLGQTFLHDPHHQRQPLDLKAGKNILPEHAGLYEEELRQIGYEFQLPRVDFEPIKTQYKVHDKEIEVI